MAGRSGALSSAAFCIYAHRRKQICPSAICYGFFKICFVHIRINGANAKFGSKPPPGVNMALLWRQCTGGCTSVTRGSRSIARSFVKYVNELRMRASM